MLKHYLTSESVTEGHPDKICDQISDAILDAILEKDKEARVACEVTITTGLIHIMGEISTKCYVDVASIARKVVNEIGYNNSDPGFNGSTCAVISSIDSQSSDIAVGVNKSLEYRSGNNDEYNRIGAGDQGLMFGYGCDETPELMPISISLAHRLAKRLTKIRKEGILKYLRPDGKTQVTMEYHDDKPVRVDAVIVSAQHSEEIPLDILRKDIKNHVIKAIIPSNLLDSGTKIYINPAGRFVTGGPSADSGLTGRKIIVDTYGGISRHGGGAFSGKDPTKVDRCASYAARYVAKNIVAAALAKKCEIQLSYAIGVAKPVSIGVDTFGTSKYNDEMLVKLVNKVFDLRPSAIIEKFDLLKPQYRKLAAYGHMGREDLDVKWEKIDKINELRSVNLQMT